MIKFIGYHFHPVGQGLISSGKIQGISDPNGIRNEFNWVYDCGTSSSLLEMTINIGGPSVEGYASWLESHEGISPLYYGKNASDLAD